MKILNVKNIWFTSDTHYGHKNIVRGVSDWTDLSKTRDFDTLEHMNTTIVNNINSVVGEDDVLFHLGDWSFGGFEKVEEFRNRIVCKNIHLVLGNHDHHIANNKDGIQSLFSSVQDYLVLDVKDTGRFILMHYPIGSWLDMARGTIHLHGHVHFNQAQKFGPGKMLDVGMCGNNLKPYRLSEIVMIMDRRPIQSALPNDHHEKIENYK